ncbi:osmotin-like protein [Phtheirospermum japonicum]|uniref:Osmotin-like protein n=1 Tax=Phtheirospermum japonicum TaxID=374723 RepID=A0A830C678_9LAMI|nr:osmotin-like protein [Phtheirospermum japonicum]
MLPLAQGASSSPWSTTAPSPSRLPFSPTPATQPSSAAASPSSPSPTTPSPPPCPTGPTASGPALATPTPTPASLEPPATQHPPRVRRPRRRHPRHHGAVLPPPRQRRPLLLRRQPRRRLQHPHDSDAPRGEGSLPGGGVQSGSARHVYTRASGEWPTARGGGWGARAAASPSAGTITTARTHVGRPATQSSSSMLAQQPSPTRTIPLNHPRLLGAA